MRRRSIASLAIAMVTSISLAGSALGFSGISNGSFEAGTFSGGGWDTLYPGSTSMTGWTIEAGNVDWIGGYWPASNGSRSVDLNGDGAGTISQTLATTTGNTYTVTFDMSANPACGPSSKTLTVGATGALSESFTYDPSVTGTALTDMKWEARTYSFVATTATTTLTFASTSVGNCGPAIDNVVVTETVPPSEIEATTLSDCKDDGWRAVVDGAGNHFKNQGDCVSYVASKEKNPGAVTP